MYTTTILSTLSALALLTPLALAQDKCQLFVTGRVETSVISSNDPFMELTRACAVSPQSKLGGNGKDCATLTFVSNLDFDKSMIQPKGTTGLGGDVEVRIFRDDLTEGFVKAPGGTDLNFQGGCDQPRGDSGEVESVRCEFTCP